MTLLYRPSEPEKGEWTKVSMVHQLLESMADEHRESPHVGHPLIVLGSGPKKGIDFGV